MLDELITFQKRALEKLRNHCAAAHNEYSKQTRDWYLFLQCGLDEFRRSQGQIQ